MAHNVFYNYIVINELVVTIVIKKDNSRFINRLKNSRCVVLNVEWSLMEVDSKCKVGLRVFNFS